MTHHDQTWGWPTKRFGLAAGMGQDEQGRAFMGGKIVPLTPEQVEAAHFTAERHEQMHRQARRPQVRRMALLAKMLTEEEWQQVVRARENR